jgi:tetratricopeptide (TPR) repeat protein
MTDHLITRRPGGAELLVPLAEQDPVLTEVLFLGADHPEGALGEVYRAVAALRAGVRESAVEHLERTLPASGRLPPEPWIELAVGQLRQRRFAAAEATLRGVIERWPQDAAARERLPIALSGLARPEEALTAVEEAVAGRPERVENWFNLGMLREAAGRLEAAREAFEHALELRPNMASGWVRLARVQRRLGRLDEARRSFEQALALDPRSEEAAAEL